MDLILSLRLFVYDPYEQRQAKMLQIRGENVFEVQEKEAFSR
jgi:hypothetical protein